ncbi:S-adenosyl-L-methionine-dependent tRNA 4-demethylwyosine synthase [Candidatus Bilamarchaeum dharawalense]|uniref:S-adenosyl-L-methionine-dependent tRNA 4-demethylwyosine synthase n=1 Tax=Candidatus Bilamarchaeum dharawalense TaxID=2885759 RepID=A0A5E4LNS6_9ARCH|nr:S-adenosyl-L-methionine-dependent tRNA 4-demethylwyosine synthase [Candidatus Bilamarchaeum dharawalense]
MVRIRESYKKGKITFSEAARKQYEKSYGIVGSHSGVQICLWNKKSIKGHRGCYKVKFYGIDCHRCAQMSPTLAWCNEGCIFCWRPMEWMKKTNFEVTEVDEPDLIIAETVKQRKRLLSGIGGAQGADRRKFDEAFRLFPSHWAISLSGEPTIYPKLSEMVKQLRARKEVRSIFIVTNGQEPDALKKLNKQKALPTQLYLSLAASNEEMFKKINRSVYKDGWKRLNKTIKLLTKLPCRRVIRLTIIKGVNDSETAIEEYAKLIEKSTVDFVEVKSYMALGFSRKRLGPKHMAYPEYLKPWTERLVTRMPNYRLIDEDTQSQILLLKNKNSRYENFIRKS